MIIYAFNYRYKKWVHVVVSMVNILDKLSLTNKLNDNLANFWINDDVLNVAKG